MTMHSLGLLQVLVWQMQPGADHQNAEVTYIILGMVTCIPYTNCTGITIGGIQSGFPILIGDSVTITCTTDSPADSIMLLQDDQPLYGTHQSTILLYTIPLVSDSIHGNTFKCEALLTGRTSSSDTAFDTVTILIAGK